MKLGSSVLKRVTNAMTSLLDRKGPSLKAILCMFMSIGIKGARKACHKLCGRFLNLF
jgi:hypothetical protein